MCEIKKKKKKRKKGSGKQSMRSIQLRCFANQLVISNKNYSWSKNLCNTLKEVYTHQSG